MSLERRFTGSNDEGLLDSPNCFYGPPWCGKCKPHHCLYLMGESMFFEEFVVRRKPQMR